jgi:hypothetical protein
MADETPNSTATVEAPDRAAIAQADSHAESEQDDVLARIMGADPKTGHDHTKASGDNESHSSDKARDEQGRFQPSKEKPSKPEAKADSKPESDTAVPEGVKSDDYRKALKALQLDGVSQKALDALDPSEIVAWGLKRAANHADIDRLKTDLGKHKSEATAKPKDSTAPAAEQPMDLTKVVEPMAKQFTEQFGVDMAAPLADFAKQLVESATAGQAAKLAEQQAFIDKINAQFTSQQQESARAKLTEKYELDKDERWDRVIAAREADKNEYASEAEAIQAACRHEFADEIIAGYEAKLKTEHQARAKGQSTTQNQKVPPKAQTQDDQDDLILGHILEGRRDQAERLGRGSYRSAGELMAAE